MKYMYLQKIWSEFCYPGSINCSKIKCCEYIGWDFFCIQVIVKVVTPCFNGCSLLAGPNGIVYKEPLLTTRSHWCLSVVECRGNSILVSVGLWHMSRLHVAWGSSYHCGISFFIQVIVKNVIPCFNTPGLLCKSLYSGIVYKEVKWIIDHMHVC